MPNITLSIDDGLLEAGRNVAAAELAICESIWSEDLNHGQKVRGILIENPLRN